jgi:hypothetical protein
MIWNELKNGGLLEQKYLWDENELQALTFCQQYLNDIVKIGSQ